MANCTIAASRLLDSIISVIRSKAKIITLVMIKASHCYYIDIKCQCGITTIVFAAEEIIILRNFDEQRSHVEESS